MTEKAKEFLDNLMEEVINRLEYLDREEVMEIFVKIYKEGHEEGYDSGYESGYESGYDEGSDPNY